MIPTLADLKARGFPNPTWLVLSLVGLAVGTSVIVILLSWGEGLSIALEEGTNKTGKNLVLCFLGRISKDRAGPAGPRRIWLTREDVSFVRRRARGIELAVAESRAWKPVGAGPKSVTIDVRGVEAAIESIRDTRVVAGRGISELDVQRRAAVAVIGSVASNRLFGSASPLGERIEIDGRPFRVVGILEDPSGDLIRDRTLQSEQVWIPISTFFSIGPRYGSDIDIVDVLLFRVRSDRPYSEAVREVRRLLTSRLEVGEHDRDALQFVTALDVLRRLPIAAVPRFLALLGVVAVSISAIGVSSFMALSVHARRHEIALRKALGARELRLLTRFAAEGGGLTLFGGCLGLLLGLAVCNVIERLDTPEILPIPVVQSGVLMIAMGVVALSALLTAVVPAYHAVRVDPSAAFRSAS